MNTYDYISLLALFVSIVSIFISWHFGFRDRANLKTFAKFYPYNPHYDRAHLKIKIVNRGRRPTILTQFGGDHKDGAYSGTVLGEQNKGLRLGEHEKYETSVYVQDLVVIDPEGNQSEYINFCFEDTLGQRHKVKKAEELIEKLRNSKENI